MDREDVLQTREQKYKARRRDRMFVSRSVTESKAFLSLKTQGACQVYLGFLGKCQWEKARIRPGAQDKAWVMTNNGRIQFTYKEAWEKYGIPAKRFTRILDELVRVGLLDIPYSGLGLHKDTTLYAISDRWTKFGTDEYQRVARPKRTLKIGFKKGNTDATRKKTTVACDC